MALSQDDIDALRKLIASGVKGCGQVEVVEISHSSFGSIYLCGQLADSFSVTLETGEVVQVVYAPMKVEKESSSNILLGDRTITIQGVNDLIAEKEESIPVDSDEKPIVKIRSFVAYNDGSISGVASGPFKLFVSQLDRNEENLASKITASTVPTNIAETGEVCTITRAPMCEGFI